MSKDEFDLRGLRVYDTSMFTKIKREEFLKEHHLKFLDISLEPYVKYIKFTEDYLDTTAEDFQHKHLKVLEDDTADWKESQEYAKRMIEIDGEFSQRFRESMIVQLYSFFEQALVSSCEMYYSNKEEDENGFLVMSDMAGFDEAKAFLKKWAKIKLNVINKELDFFAKLCTLRNRIVHHGITSFSDEESKINNIRAISKNRFIFREEKNDFGMTYHIYFDNPAFSFEIIEEIKSLYKKLGKYGVYY